MMMYVVTMTNEAPWDPKEYTESASFAPDVSGVPRVVEAFKLMRMKNEDKHAGRINSHHAMVSNKKIFTHADMKPKENCDGDPPLKLNLSSYNEYKPPAKYPSEPDHNGIDTYGRQHC